MQRAGVLAMRAFSSTDLANRTGDVLAVAAVEPVEIQRHGKPRFVLMSRDRYERLTGGQTQQAHHIDDLPTDLRALLSDALQKELDDDQ